MAAAADDGADGDGGGDGNGDKRLCGFAGKMVISIVTCDAGRPDM